MKASATISVGNISFEVTVVEETSSGFRLLAPFAVHGERFVRAQIKDGSGNLRVLDGVTTSCQASGPAHELTVTLLHEIPEGRASRSPKTQPPLPSNRPMPKSFPPETGTRRRLSSSPGKSVSA